LLKLNSQSRSDVDFSRDDVEYSTGQILRPQDLKVSTIPQQPLLDSSAQIVNYNKDLEGNYDDDYTEVEEDSD